MRAAAAVRDRLPPPPRAFAVLQVAGAEPRSELREYGKLPCESRQWNSGRGAIFTASRFREVYESWLVRCRCKEVPRLLDMDNVTALVRLVVHLRAVSHDGSSREDGVAMFRSGIRT